LIARAINVIFRRRTDSVKAGDPTDPKTDQQADDDAGKRD
jgi:hypothetical protein